VTEHRTLALDLLAGEIAEKVCRIDTVLDAAERDAPSSEHQVVSAIRDMVDVLKHELFYALSAWREGRKPSRPEEPKTALGRQMLFADGLMRVVNHFHPVHLQLGLLSTSWIGSETQIFLRGLFRTSPAAIERISVVASREYAFAEAGLPGETLGRGGPEDNSGNQTVVVLLPRIELRNPLNWAMGAHEAAHAIMHMRGVRESLERIWSRTRGLQRESFFAWTQELLADYLACTCLLDAYPVSLALYAFTSRQRIDSVSVSHPELLRRIRDLMNLFLPVWGPPKLSPVFLEPPGFGSASLFFPAGESDIGDLSVLLNDLVDLTLHLPQTRAQGVNRTEYPFQTHELLEALKGIVVESQRDLRTEHPKAEYDSATRKALLKRLNQHVPIGSFPSSPEQPAVLKCQSAELKDHLEEGKPLTGDCTDLKKDLFNSIRELPTTMTQIINTGWHYRLTVSHERFSQAFLNEGYSLDDPKKGFLKRLDDYRAHIEERDKLLLKSIEIAHYVDVLRELPDGA